MRADPEAKLAASRLAHALALSAHDPLHYCPLVAPCHVADRTRPLDGRPVAGYWLGRYEQTRVAPRY
jgi:hypothetical protein